MNAAPKMKSNIWDVSRYILEQFAAIMSSNVTKSDKHNSKINCKLSISHYNKSK